MDDIKTELLRELLNGAWFILSATIFVMFAYIASGAWRRGGYRSIITKASLALTVFFAGLSGSQGWLWLHIWLPRHGFHYALSWIEHFRWWPVITAMIAMTGALCLIRVFFPLGRDVSNDAREIAWIIPVLVVVILKLMLALV